jgi:hypothetical protein
MIKRQVIAFTLLILFCALSSQAMTPERHEQIKNISSAEWQQIADGERPWPKALFPLCSISPEEKKDFPPAYWEKVLQDEHNWETYTNQQRAVFQKEYGPDIKHLYDLFLYDKRCAAGEEPVADCVRETKTLERLHDVVAVSADRLSALQNNKVRDIRLFSYKRGGLHVIPCDILEVTEKGRIVLPEGPEGNPSDGDGRFNQQDKMVFMAVDAGHKIPEQIIRNQYPGIKALSEIELGYDDRKAWVYGAAFAQNTPPVPDFDYAGINPETGRVFGSFIFAGCASRNIDDTIVPTHKVQGTFASPAIGARPVDMLKAFTYNLVIHFRPFAHMEQGMEDMDVRWRGLYDGRVLIYNRASWKLWTPFGIGAPIIYADLVVTPLSAITYGSVWTPFNPKLVVKSVDLTFGEDMEIYDDDFFHFRFVTMGDRTGVKMDGKMSEKEKNLDINDYSWYLLTGNPGTLCIRTEYDAHSTRHADIKLKWQDDAEKSGYTNLFSMNKFDQPNSYFTHEWNLVPYFYNADPEKYNWDNLDIVLRRADKPLSTSINGSAPLVQSRYLHLPNIKESKKAYDY